MRNLHLLSIKIMLLVTLAVVVPCIAKAQNQNCPGKNGGGGNSGGGNGGGGGQEGGGGGQGGGQGEGGGENGGDGGGDGDGDGDGGGGGDSIQIPLVHAVDPNDIVGPVGIGERKRWISLRDRLGYRIRFENNPQFATAPAQNVFVYMPILPGINANSVRIGGFGFGKYTFPVPENSSYYATRLDLKDSIGLYVDFTAGIDVTRNRLFWIFRSIDPVTGQAPANAFQGFLPVNDTAITRFNDFFQKPGEGYVTFTLDSKKDLVTGDTVTAKATIIFDNNEEIPTNLWTNTIDAGAPVSRIDMATVQKDTVRLFWSGQDDARGSGIKNYSVYVSQNNGPFTLYKPSTSSTSDHFVGVPGNTYCFFTLATDSTGNQEALKSSCDIAVTIEPDTLLPANWLYFRGQQRPDNIELTWGLNHERDIDSFRVERSLDSVRFNSIASVRARGNDVTNNYEFLDRDNFPDTLRIIFYRVRQNNEDGSFGYSNTVRIGLDPRDTIPASNFIIRAYPNPFTKQLTLLINTPGINAAGADQLNLYTIDGKIVYSKNLSGRQNNVPITLTDLPLLLPGAYVLVLNLDGRAEVIKLIRR